MKPRWPFVLLAFVPALLVAAWQAAWPWPFFSDDSFVSLRYAERLLDGHGLTWTDGERVEGYSNLLWVLLCSGLGALGLDLVTAARGLGAACTAGALWCLVRAARPNDGASTCIAAIAPLLVATSGTVMAWTLGGLEGPLMLLCLAAGFGALVRAFTDEPHVELWPRATVLRASVPFALACWTRPDSPLWVASAGIVLGLASHRAGLRTMLSRTLLFAALPLLAFAAQLAFRLAYYGEWVPNTAHVKAQFDPGSAASGIDYVASALWTSPGLTWPALLGAVVLLFRRPTRPLAIVLVVPTLAWLGYLAVIGGDHFPGRRLLHGALAPLALLGGLTTVVAATLAPLQRRIVTITIVFVGLLAASANVWFSRTDPKFVENRFETWEWRGEIVGQALARAFANEQPRVAIDAAGAVPFYARLPMLDMLGLCDATIAKTPFRDWLLDVRARGTVPLPPGHLRGNGAYVMEQSPDLILMGPPPGLPLPVFVSALEFEADPRFRDRYRCVLVDLGERTLRSGQTETIRVPLWTLLHGKVGVRREPDRVTIPAWLFGSYRLERPLMVKQLPPPPDSAEGRAIAQGLAVVGAFYHTPTACAVPDANGRFELELRAARAELALPLPAGRWALAIEPKDAALRPFAAGHDGGEILVESEREVTLVLERSTGPAGPVRAHHVVLTRVR